MKIILGYVFTCFLIFGGCGPHKDPVIPSPCSTDASVDGGAPTLSDGGLEATALVPDTNASDVAALDDCARACLNLHGPAVRCKVGDDVPGIETCAQSCRHVKSSHLMPLDIPCAEKARSIADAHKCKGWGC